MALAKKPIVQNKRLIALVVLLLAFGILVVIVASGGLSSLPWFSSSTINQSLNTPTLNPGDLPVYADLGEKVLDDPRLSNLQTHGVFPIQAGQTGRTNPFVEGSPNQ